MDTVGERIKKARKDKGLTQAALADAVGVQRQSIIKWERNEASPSRANVDRLSDALDLPKSAMNPYGAGGISATSGQYSGSIPHIEWHQIPDFAHKDTAVEMQLVTVHVGPSNEVATMRFA